MKTKLRLGGSKKCEAQHSKIGKFGGLNEKYLFDPEGQKNQKTLFFLEIFLPVLKLRDETWRVAALTPSLSSTYEENHPHHPD